MTLIQLAADLAQLHRLLEDLHSLQEAATDAADALEVAGASVRPSRRELTALDLDFDLLDVGVHFLEGARGGVAMLLELALKNLLPVRQVLNVSPGTKDLSAAYLCMNFMVVREVSVIQFAIVTQEKAAKV